MLHVKFKLKLTDVQSIKQRLEICLGSFLRIEITWYNYSSKTVNGDEVIWPFCQASVYISPRDGQQNTAHLHAYDIYAELNKDAPTEWSFNLPRASEKYLYYMDTIINNERSQRSSYTSMFWFIDRNIHRIKIKFDASDKIDGFVLLENLEISTSYQEEL
jgi:hypothetical protein